ncbi:hypothetical protein RHGRI_018651 [Rhododendron griersonianum]|uniref:GDSL esterase/lipase n=1 Tax=Rhododendron griersonianum TaxID=479676 RepID=A0AAV6K2I1_9ERIC|nr:hypothetical protein RHGRI_018651 [Rhododendron griersonianum]
MAQSMTTFLCLSLVVVVVRFLGLSEAQKQVPAMYVFGDSLVDVGNNNHLKISIAKANFPHNGVDYAGDKPTGRFSNGKNFADFIAEKAGLVASPPPYLSFVSNKSNEAFPITGVSFASGGAGIFNGTDERYRQSLPLPKQVNYYSTVYEDLVQQLGSADAQNHLSKSLFTVVVGSNDLFDYFKSGSDVSKKSTPQQYVDSMLTALKQELKSLHDFGGRKYVIAGIGAVGCCPSERNQNKNEECHEEENQMALKYNEGLKSMLKGLKSELKGDMNYSYVDVYGIFDSFIRTPSNFGFTEVKAACCGLGNLKAQVPCVPVATYCSNRSDHIFWDLYHPTEATARILVDIVFGDSQQSGVPMNIEQLIAA